tara:strand:- start:2989 stop:4152 length:1164 start_codon:yes stop_codon:yes gene_type:complete
MRIKYLIYFSLGLVTIIFTQDAGKYSPDDFVNYQKQQMEAFQNYKQSVTAQYADYERREKEAFEQYKKEIEEKWEEFKSPEPKTFVEYSEDLNSRQSIDFEKGEVTIEVIVEEEPSPSEPTQTEKQKEEKVKDTLTKELVGLIKKKADDNKPILKNQLENKNGKEVNEDNAKKEVVNIVKDKKIEKKPYKSKDGKKRVKYTVKVPLKTNHLDERAKRFEDEILKQSKRWKLDPAIVFALMEAESSFNPKARSHIPAFGLMQLVPKSGARDAYKYVYKVDKLVTGDYLYKPVNNIELGCAYFSKIRYYYFENIENDELAYICSIPAYNTGIGNVSKTLCGKPYTNPAAKVASSMTADELYQKLTSDLKYEEARNYLKKVWKYKEKYKG